ncbi:UNVERIFIED_CONTAM: hypothetical protein PYX00_004704 [Menopon gallinae]|uniref:Phosphoacetylglucosamine mutase n=1 Tax=Menopon gallinae TaxID=328185 RepID=A0AAW2I5H0_9NEOP
MSFGFRRMAFNIDLKKAAKSCDKFLDYGTSGFRSRAEDLDHVLYRTGILSVLRSKKKNGETIGLMITASHNPHCDNGVKLIDPDGEMMEQSWETLATTLINADNDSINETVKKIVESEKIDLNQKASIFIGQDTRSSSPALSQLAISGIKALNGSYTDFGVVTTPVLHYMVYCMNAKKTVPRIEDYDNKLINSFNLLNNSYVKNVKYFPEITLDGANGVGAIKVNQLKKGLEDVLQIHIYNDGSGELNYKCGADYVKVNQRLPDGITIEPNVRCVSLDGDADRLIYYYVDEKKQFHMLDGDRIATLIAGYIMELVQYSKVGVSLGLVQTAYANGNSTDYITNQLKVPVACVPTGVKHLHEKAKEFDIGVYFEANGHGTVLYSEEAAEKIRTAAESKLNEKERKSAAQRLLDLMNLTNQTVGDAISDMLLVETVLKARDWSMSDWAKCYTDLPNRLMKVAVKDRTVIKTTDAERVCTKPEGLQDEINRLISRFGKGRAFVRPSGTEDVVRVYSEASTQAEADELAKLVAAAVHRLAGGVGEAPGL